MQITVGQIATSIGGIVEGDSNIYISGASKIEDGQLGTFTFLANPKYNEHIYTTKAAAVLVDKDFKAQKDISTTLIRVENVYVALAILMETFDSSITLQYGIARTAIVAASATIDTGTLIDDYVIIKPNVKIGKNTKIYGHVFIGDKVEIGDNVTLYPGVKIYHNCIIGNNCTIHANAVIGSDGFGFAKDDDGQFKKIPQTGNVVLEDNIEIGSNTVIDRASIGSTLIKTGTKLDNLIQVGHSVTIGSNTAIAAQTALAGSAEIGDNCIIGGQVGIAGHIKIANGTMIQGQSGISSNIKTPNTKLYGTPALDYQNYLKSYAYFKKLPEIVQQLREIQSKVDTLSYTQTSANS